MVAAHQMHNILQQNSVEDFTLIEMRFLLKHYIATLLI